MLSQLLRRAGASATALTLLTTGAVLFPASEAPANVSCPNGQIVIVDGEQICVTSLHGLVPPSGEPIRFEEPTGSGGGAAPVWCERHDGVDSATNPTRVLCRAGDWWFNRDWDCYVRHSTNNQNGGPVEPEPWMQRRGVDDGVEGRVYDIRCYPPQEAHLAPPSEGTVPFMDGFGLWMWEEQIVGPVSPPGEPEEGSVIPALWVEAMNSLAMRGPQIATAPPDTGAGLVNLPVWLWTETGGNVWPTEPLHAAAEAPGLDQRVDAFARPTGIVWDMGDGGQRECPGPGEAWQSGLNFLNPGECSYIYRRSSRHQPDGTYQITAVTTWEVTWQINGVDDGDLEIQVGSTTSYQVDEIQVLTSRS